MKLALALLCAAGFTCAAQADTVTAKYTSTELKKCHQLLKADGKIFEGAWRCPGIDGNDVFISAADSRDLVGFGTSDARNCSSSRTFGGFNSAGGTVEWRLRGGKPFAAIIRFTVSIDPNDANKLATWLVVHKLDKGGSCPVHYVAGSFPKANEAARLAADTKAEGFDCQKDKPTFDSTIGPPGIDLTPCGAAQP
jgi:hypothetical protein